MIPFIVDSHASPSTKTAIFVDRTGFFLHLSMKRDSGVDGQDVPSMNSGRPVDGDRFFGWSSMERAVYVDEPTAQYTESGLFMDSAAPDDPGQFRHEFSALTAFAKVPI